MKTFVLVCCLTFTLFVFAAIAQTAKMPDKPSTDSGLKVIGFSFEKKAVARYEPAAVSDTGIAARAMAMSAENGREPNNGQYYRTEKRTEERRYATLQVKNEGAKEIHSVVWEYTHPHFKGDSEIGYTETKTKLKIAPKESAVLSTLVAQNDCHPGWLIEGGNYFVSGICGRKIQKRTKFYPMEAKLKQINYKDGTAWKAP